MTDEQLEAIKDVLDRNQDFFSKHKADIGCCNFVEHEIELDESAVPHREGARSMTPNKLDAYRKARSNNKDEPEFTILRRREAARGEDSLKEKQPDNKLCKHWFRKSQKRY